MVRTLGFHPKNWGSIPHENTNNSVRYTGKYAGPGFDTQHVHTQTDNPSHMGVYLALTAYEVRYIENYLTL